jgi:hypothetical protein
VPFLKDLRRRMDGHVLSKYQLKVSAIVDDMRKRVEAQLEEQEQINVRFIKETKQENIS